MWVAQVTEPLDQGQHNEVFSMLLERFPAYQFSIMMGPAPYIIARPRDETIQFPEDEATERDVLLFIVTELIGEILTGHLITDGQEQAAPPHHKE